MKQRSIYLNCKFALMFIVEKMLSQLWIKMYGMVMPDPEDWTVNVLVKCQHMHKFKINTNTAILETWCEDNVGMADYGVSGDGRSIVWFNFKDKADAVSFRLNCC